MPTGIIYHYHRCPRCGELWKHSTDNRCSLPYRFRCAVCVFRKDRHDC